MHYKKLDDGNLLIFKTVKSEQIIIDKIIETIDAYRSTFSVKPLREFDDCKEDDNLK